MTKERRVLAMYSLTVDPRLCSLSEIAFFFLFYNHFLPGVGHILKLIKDSNDQLDILFLS